MEVVEVKNGGFEGGSGVVGEGVCGVGKRRRLGV